MRAAHRAVGGDEAAGILAQASTCFSSRKVM